MEPESHRRCRAAATDPQTQAVLFDGLRTGRPLLMLATMLRP